MEFRLPVDSDNPVSQRFVRAFSMLDQIVQKPDEWFALVTEALPEVRSDWAKAAEAAAEEAFEREPPGRSAFLADVHERRLRDPRKFLRAAQSMGTGNRVIVDLRLPAPDPRTERFGGQRHFNLQDIENMRVDEAIGNMPRYAQEYEADIRAGRGPPRNVGDLVTGMYDPNYLGRLALDHTNAFRAQQRLPPITWSQALADIAAEHAGQMARGEMPFSHKDFDKRVARYPFPHVTAAENLAYNGGVSDTARVAVDGWIKSPGHRKNLMGAFNLCGIGVARSAGGPFFYTQLFARTYGALC